MRRSPYFAGFPLRNKPKPSRRRLLMASLATMTLFGIALGVLGARSFRSDETAPPPSVQQLPTATAIFLPNTGQLGLLTER